MITQAPRGTQDWYGEEMYKREVVERICREAAALFNITQIMTPVFEHTILFQRGVGETTDVVQKEMYTFEDKGGRSVTLKPEGTAGAIRAYVEHSLYAEGGVRKIYYITPAFRYEKPQSGRLRQHHQFGVEMIGSGSPMIEADLISLVETIIKKIGLKGMKLHINSIGCGECRKKYNEVLKEYLNLHRDELCETCRERMERNPLRVLDCKIDTKIAEGAPRTVDYLCEECAEHFEKLKLILDGMNIDYEIDPGIVRGLDYYTRTVFEFVDGDGFTLCGGGRYDKLVHEIEEKLDIPSAGFGMGIERVLYFANKQGIDLGKPPAPEIFIGSTPACREEAYKITCSLRTEGITAETDYLERSVKAQMKYADKIGAAHAVIIGEDEIAGGSVNLKNMSDGSRISCRIEDIASLLKSAD